MQLLTLGIEQQSYFTNQSRMGDLRKHTIAQLDTNVSVDFTNWSWLFIGNQTCCDVESGIRR